jgi:DNA-binding LacI/PurR family transcriptional regulator
MVPEFAILFGIQHLEQGAGGIAAEIAAGGAECAEIALDEAPERVSILSAGNFPVGFFAVTDETALALMNRLRRRGFAVGEKARAAS